MRKKGNVGVKVLVNILGLCMIIGGVILILQGIPREYWRNVFFILFGYLGIAIGAGVLKDINGGE